jgi:hypothetical protein
MRSMLVRHSGRWSCLGVILITGIILSWSLEPRAEQKPTLAILPFLVEKTEDPARGAVVCPFCKSVFRGGIDRPGAENTLTRLLYNKMEEMGTFLVLPIERVREVFSHTGQARLEENPTESAVLLGKELQVDFVFLGFLFRFEERVGSSIGVEKPASVGFDLHLVQIRDGREAWKGTFDETQRPLSEDIRKIGTFLRRGAVWLTAEELASAGMSETLRKLPGVKEQEEGQ